MGDLYKAFDKNTNEYDTNWFLRTSMKISVLTGAFFAAKKLKGPAKQLVYSIFESRIKKIQERDEWKSRPNFDLYFGENASINLPNRSFERDDELYKERFESSRNSYKSSGKRAMTVAGIDGEETSIIQNINQDLINSKVKYPSHAPPVPNIDPNKLFFVLRRDALWDYLAHNNYIKSGDMKRIEDLKDPVNDGEALKNILDEYINTDPDFADIYTRTLTKAKSRYLSDPHRDIIDLDLAEKKLIGMSIIETDLNTSLKLRVGATHKFKNILNSDTIDKLISGGTKITSGSLHTKAFIPNAEQYRILGQFDYTSDIKKLISKIKELQLNEKYGFKNIIYEIISEGTSDIPRFYFRITATHATRKGEQVISIPLAQHGRLPAASPYATQRTDFSIPKIVGDSKLSINEANNNSSQLMLKNVIRAFDSAMMSDYSYDPAGTFGKIQRSANRQIQEAARMEGTARDAGKAGMVLFKDKRFSNTLMLNRSFENINTLREMARSSKNGSINITIDLETISPTRTGPDVQATDPHTQITQAGYSVAEIDSTNKVSIKHVKNYFSDHGVDKIKTTGFTIEHTAWLKEYLPDDIKNSLKSNLPEEIGDAWGKYMNELVKKQGRSFLDNQDIARHLISKIRNVIAENKGKSIYITTKFGTAFDLKILNLAAPTEFAQLMKEAKHLDIHGVAHLQQMINGSTDSLSQSRLLQNMMGNYGMSNLDFSNSNDIIKAVSFLKDKGHIVMSHEMFQRMKDYKTLAAHDAGTDAMLLHTLVGFELNKYVSNKKALDTGYDKLEHLFHNYTGFKTLIEQYNESRGLERTEIGGMTLSSMGLSQGQIAKFALSTLQTRHFLPNPDNPVAKQWNQMQMGSWVVLGGHHGNIADMTDLQRKKARKKLLSSFVSEGELNAIGWARNADAMTNLFSNTVITKHFATITAYGNREGGNHISPEVLDRVHLMHLEQGVNLSEVASDATDVSLSQQIHMLHKEIELEAKRLADKDGVFPPTQDHYDVAANNVVSKNTKLACIPKGSKMMASSGDKGMKSFKAPVDGKIKNIHVNVGNDRQIQVMADIEYLITRDSELPLVGRGASKNVIIKDSMLLNGMMYGGAESFGPASFLEKNYAGSMKNTILQKGFDNLFEIIDDESRPQSVREEAKVKIKKLAVEINSTVDFRNSRVIHNSYKDGIFAKIKGGTELSDAQKFMGNIDMNIQKLRAFMIDTGQVWTLEKAKELHRIFDQVGPGNPHGKSNVLHDIYLDQVSKIKKDLDTSAGDIGKMIHDFENGHITKIQEGTEGLIKDFILPPIPRIEAGEPIPMFFEAREKYKGAGVYDIGFFGNQSMAVYGTMTGEEARPTKLKLRRSLLQQTQFSNMSPSTRNVLEGARRSKFSGKFQAAVKSREIFLDALIGKMSIKNHLSIDEVRSMLNIKAGLDLEKLKRQNLTTIERAEVLDDLTAVIEKENRYGTEKATSLAEKILDDLTDDSWAKAVLDKKNKSFISLQSAQHIAKLGGEHNILSLSAMPELGNVFTFDLNDLLQRSTGKHEQPSVDEVMNVFKKLAGAKDSFIDSIDETNKVVKLKHLVMKAPTHVDNVINLVSKKAGPEAFGYTTDEMVNLLRVNEAYDVLHKNIKEKNNLVKESSMVLNKQYLTYLMRTVISIDEDEITPHGFTARAQDANQIFIRLNEIKAQGGWAKVHGFKGNVKEAEAFSERIINSFSMADMFVHADNYKKNFQFSYAENKNLIGKNHYKHLCDKFGPDKADEILRMSSLTGGVTRFPNAPAGQDAFLESRFNIVPKEMAPHLGMDINMIAVVAEYWRLVGGDTDRDAVFGVVHAFDTIPAMLNHQRNHDTAFQEQLNAIVDDKGVLKTLREKTNEAKYFIGIEAAQGNVQVGTMKNGYLNVSSVPINSATNENIFKGFKYLTETVETIGAHDPNIVTSQFIKGRVDQAALVAVSKNSIGIFTNILTKRSRELMSMDAFKDNNILKQMMIGNFSSGLSGLQQKMISMSKHGVKDIEELSLAAKALMNPFNEDIEASKALRKVIAPLFKSEHLDQAHMLLTEAIREHYKRLGPKEQLNWMANDAQERMELGDHSSLLDTVKTRLSQDYISLPDMVSEEVKKQVKFTHLQGFLKKNSKYGAIGAGIYLAANFFRPNKLSNSMNPLDAFTDLDSNINGNHNGILSSLELDRSVPLDMVNASFSDQAYIRMNKVRHDTHKSKIINDILDNGYKNNNPLMAEWKSSPNLNYTNYTTDIGYFGSSQLDRRSKY